MLSNDSKKSIVCPECGGQLAIWYEMVSTHSRKVNPKNGDILKKVSKSDPEKSDCHGIQCTVCDWHQSDNDLSDEGMEVSEMINFDQLNFN